MQAEIEAELEEKKRLEEEAEQARFDALPEEEKQRILAERAAEQEKAEAERQALLAENKAKRDAIAAKEEARLAAKRAESEKERAEAMVRGTRRYRAAPQEFAVLIHMSPCSLWWSVVICCWCGL